MGGFSHDTQKTPFMNCSSTLPQVHTPPGLVPSGWTGHPTLGCLPAQSPPRLGFQSLFPPAACHAHGKDKAPPVMNSMGPNPVHHCRAGANWTLVQNSLLLLLGHILKVTGEARQGETNVCHLSGPPGHVHTSDLVTRQEIIPLEGTGSRFSIPSS